MTDVDRRTLLGAAVVTSALRGPVIESVAPADPSEVLPLWPNGAPGGDGVRVVEQVTERSTDPAYRDRFAVGITDPSLTVVRPERPNGASLLLIPGGGYRLVTVDIEGLDIARVFAAAGVTCYVLRYRLPSDGWAAGPDAPLQDAQRALRLVRARAVVEGLDPSRVAVLGASAGGHLTGLLATRTDPTYDAVDHADAQPHRPDLTFLMYPVVALDGAAANTGSRRHLLGETPTAQTVTAYSMQRADWSGAAPVMLVHAMDDRAVPVENSLLLLAALRAAGVPAEAHLFQEGGHGFGVRKAAGMPAETWPALAMAWGKRHGWLVD